MSCTFDELGLRKRLLNIRLELCPHFVLHFCVDLMDGLREIPNREALKLRAEASSNKTPPSFTLFVLIPCAFV